MPSIAARILQGANAGEGIAIKLQAIGIGDGWVDPITQYRSFPVFGYDRGLIGPEAYSVLNKTADLCVALILDKRYDSAWLGAAAIVVAC